MNLTTLFFRLDEEKRIHLCGLPLTAAFELAGPSAERAAVNEMLTACRMAGG
ncbi:hypothetical protein [Bradyrhizobium sp. BR 1432]|uniref:hypothetical protein n=1 Tax=Bradyrhizobium sp. BR 1432 TaxID=3447966 RepID=UPI003EE64ADE